MKGHILLADDDLFCRRSLKQILESEGYLVDEARSGSELMELLTGSRYDLGIYDYHLPTGGISSVLPSIHVDMPFVIMTGDVSLQTERMARGLSPSFFFVKPIEMSDFLNVIVRVLRTGECEWRKRCW